MSSEVSSVRSCEARVAYPDSDRVAAAAARVLFLNEWFEWFATTAFK